MKTHPKREDLAALRPVGLAMAAVVAGLGAQAQAEEVRVHAPHEPASSTQIYALDPTNHPGFEEDADMIVGPSAPVAPFGER